MKRWIHSFSNINADTRSELIENFNYYYSKKDKEHRTFDKDGNVCFTRPQIVNCLLKSYNKQHEAELDGVPLTAELRWYEDKNRYNIGFWYVE